MGKAAVWLHFSSLNSTGRAAPSGAKDGLPIPKWTRTLLLVVYLASGSGTIPVTWYGRMVGSTTWKPIEGATTANLDAETNDKMSVGIDAGEYDRIACAVVGPTGTYVLEAFVCCHRT